MPYSDDKSTSGGDEEEETEVSLPAPPSILLPMSIAVSVLVTTEGDGKAVGGDGTMDKQEQQAQYHHRHHHHDHQQHHNEAGLVLQEVDENKELTKQQTMEDAFDVTRTDEMHKEGMQQGVRGVMPGSPHRQHHPDTSISIPAAHTNETQSTLVSTTEDILIVQRAGDQQDANACLTATTLNPSSLQPQELVQRLPTAANDAQKEAVEEMVPQQDQQQQQIQIQTQAYQHTNTDDTVPIVPDAETSLATTSSPLSSSTSSSASSEVAFHSSPHTADRDRDRGASSSSSSSVPPAEIGAAIECETSHAVDHDSREDHPLNSGHAHIYAPTTQNMHRDQMQTQQHHVHSNSNAVVEDHGKIEASHIHLHDPSDHQHNLIQVSAVDGQDVFVSARLIRDDEDVHADDLERRKRSSGEEPGADVGVGASDRTSYEDDHSDSWVRSHSNNITAAFYKSATSGSESRSGTKTEPLGSEAKAARSIKLTRGIHADTKSRNSPGSAEAHESRSRNNHVPNNGGGSHNNRLQARSQEERVHGNNAWARRESELMPPPPAGMFDEGFLHTAPLTVPHRVKFYVLNDKGSWEDRGTGTVTCEQVLSDSFQRQPTGIALALRVISELTGDVLLFSHVRHASAFYRQQNQTIISWAEPLANGNDGSLELALSFADIQGCRDVWQEICRVEDACDEAQINEVHHNHHRQGNPSSVGGNHASSSSRDFDHSVHVENGGYANSNELYGHSGSHGGQVYDLVMESERWTDEGYRYSKSNLDEINDALMDTAHENEEARAQVLSNRMYVPSFPLPQRSNIEEIFKMLYDLLSKERLDPRALEKVASELCSDMFISCLVDVFRRCEDVDDIQGLHCCNRIVRAMISLGNSSLIQFMLSDDYAMDIVGTLEYNPDLNPGISFGIVETAGMGGGSEELGNPTAYSACVKPVTAEQVLSREPRERHRDFLRDTAKFKQVVPIKDPAIVAKIHQNFRISYIKDVILSRTIDEPAATALSSVLVYNNADITTYFMTERPCLEQVFQLLKGADTSHSSTASVELDPEHGAITEATPAAEPNHDSEVDLQFLDAMKFLVELCGLSKPLQPPFRTQFYSTMIDCGLFDICLRAVRSGNSSAEALGVELFGSAVSNDAAMVRSLLLSQPKADYLFAALIEKMCGSDVTVLYSAADLVRTLLDVDPAQAGSEKDDFLNSFYEHFAVKLVEPLEVQTEAERTNTQGLLEVGKSPVLDLGEDAVAGKADAARAVCGSNREDIIVNGDSALSEPSGPLVSFASEGSALGDSKGCHAEKQLANQQEMSRGMVPLDPTAYAICVEKQAGVEMACENRRDIQVPLIASPGKSVELDLFVENPLDTSRASIIDLLCFCVLNHGYRAKQFINEFFILEKVSKFLSHPANYMRHGALRFLKTCISLMDESLFAYFVSRDLLEPIVQVYATNREKNNLLVSGVLELLDFVRAHKILPLAKEFVSRYADVFDASPSKALYAGLRELVIAEETQSQTESRPSSIVSKPPSSVEGKTTQVAGDGAFSSVRQRESTKNVPLSLAGQLSDESKALSRKLEFAEKNVEVIEEEQDIEPDQNAARCSSAYGWDSASRVASVMPSGKSGTVLTSSKQSHIYSTALPTRSTVLSKETLAEHDKEWKGSVVIGGGDGSRTPRPLVSYSYKEEEEDDGDEDEGEKLQSSDDYETIATRSKRASVLFRLSRSLASSSQEESGGDSGEDIADSNVKRGGGDERAEQGNRGVALDGQREVAEPSKKKARIAVRLGFEDGKVVGPPELVNDGAAEVGMADASSPSEVFREEDSAIIASDESDCGSC